MSSNESDISWQALREIVHGWAGASAELGEVRPLDGGMINTTLCLTLGDGQRAVLKISPHRVNREYQREAHHLEMLRGIGVPAPAVYKADIGSLDAPNSYILMEFVDGIDLVEARQKCSADQFASLQEHLAEIVATIHERTSPVYSRISADPTGAFEKWCDFYRHIYDHVVKEAEKNAALPIKARKQISRIHDKLDGLIDHGDEPRLVHWDIWATNLLARPNENGNWRICAVLDPMCKFAHAEAEIAYMDLFRTSTPAFNKAYQHYRRLDEGYHRVRKQIYQLYPLINHINLFGNEYVKPMLGALEKASVLV